MNEKVTSILLGVVCLREHDADKLLYTLVCGIESSRICRVSDLEFLPSVNPNAGYLIFTIDGESFDDFFCDQRLKIPNGLHVFSLE